MAQIDFSPIGDLANIWRQGQQHAARQSALAPLANSADAESYDRAARQLLASGDLQGGLSLATLAQKYGDRQSALKLSESFSSMFGGQQPPAQPAATTAPSSAEPRGLRNNNPLNIEAGQFTQGQPGYVGSDGRFARFQQPQQGVDAAGKLLDTYQSKHGLNTVRGIIGRWAPQGENDTSGYVASVAARMGIDPDQPLSPEQRQPLIQAMAQFENGRPLPSQNSAVTPAVASAPQSAPQASSGPQAPQAVFAGKPLDQWVQGMSRIATHPSAPPEVRKFATEFVQGAIKESGLTNDQKEYGTYVKQGGRDDYTSWLRKNKTAGATTINTAEGLDAAQMRARIDVDKSAIADHAKKVVAGRAVLPLLDQIVSIADKTPGGWAGQASPTFAKALATFGLPVPEKISNAELMISLTRQLVPGVRDPGAASNLEQNMYVQALPNLSQSPEGRLKVAGMMRALVDRNVEIMRVYRANLGSPDLDKKLADLDNKPIFTPEDRKLIERYAGAGGGTGGAGAAQAAPGAISEGATATNKATGQKIIFKGGQWIPAT